jgi:outer membrane biosynthesis protein TonB
MCTWGGNISIVFPGQVTVQTGASGAGSAKSLSGRSAGKTSGTSSSEDSKQQNKVLQKAAKEATPFCKEPQKKEETKEKAEKTNAEEKKEEKNEEKPQKEITRIFWIDEQSGEQKTLEELPPGYEVTLCVETKNIDDGENVEIEITDENGRNYKGGKQSLKFSSTVEADGTAYMENVKLEFDEK